MGLGLARRAAVGCAVVAGLVPLGAGAAVACDGGHHDAGVAGAGYTTRHAAGTHGVLAVASAYLGLAPSAIKAQLEQGKSLGQVADATAGKSAAGLVDAYTAALKAKLDALVTKGRLTSAQEAAFLAKAAPWIAKLVNTTWTHHDGAFRAAFHHH
jgi:hypothetical protein